jgi:hypothetical protein
VPLLDARHIRHHLEKLDQRSVTMTCGWKRGMNNGKAVEQECESSMVVQGYGVQGFNGGARVEKCKRAREQSSKDSRV